MTILDESQDPVNLSSETQPIRLRLPQEQDLEVLKTYIDQRVEFDWRLIQEKKATANTSSETPANRPKFG